MLSKMPVILRLKQVLGIVDISESTIYRRERIGQFPKKQKWGRMVYWFDYQIEDFLKNPSKYSRGKKNGS